MEVYYKNIHEWQTWKMAQNKKKHLASLSLWKKAGNS
jgi:hypothetical protein